MYLQADAERRAVQTAQGEADASAQVLTPTDPLILLFKCPQFLSILTGGVAFLLLSIYLACCLELLCAVHMTELKPLSGCNCNSCFGPQPDSCL